MIRRGKAFLFDNDESDSFFVSWSDVLCLLLVLFVFIVSISEIDATKLKSIQQSVDQTFSISTSNIQAQNQHALALDNLFNSLETVFSNQKAIHLQKTPTQIALDFGENILFESGKAVLHPKGVVLLSQLVKPLKSKAVQIEVSGHTDSISISNDDFASNWHLSGSRSAEVIHFLVNKGLSPEMFKLVAHSANKPIADNANEQGRQKNRRVSFLIQIQELNDLNSVQDFESSKQTQLQKTLLKGAENV